VSIVVRKVGFRDGDNAEMSMVSLGNSSHIETNKNLVEDTRSNTKEVQDGKDTPQKKSARPVGASKKKMKKGFVQRVRSRARSGI